MLANEIDVVEFKTTFHKMINVEQLSGDQIYNCDETGFNFKMMHTKTLVAKQETKAPGFKKAKKV